MADTKISALPASTTPLAGTEVLPIVQASTTRQVSVANLTAGRAISATQLTLTTGSVIVASGQGVDFSATSHPAGMTSELFNDYEEGTWTPTLTFGGASTGITYVGNYGFYTKIGGQVFLTGYIELSSKGSATGYADIKSLPFTVQNTNGNTGAASLWFSNISFTNVFQGRPPLNTTQIALTQITILGAVSDITDANFSNNSALIFAANYRV